MNAMTPFFSNDPVPGTFPVAVDENVRALLRAYLQQQASVPGETIERSILNLLVLLRHLYYTDFADQADLDSDFGMIEEAAFEQWSKEDLSHG